MFLFKQKTAYEMRISDWRSDVCSSDLQRSFLHHLFQVASTKPCQWRQAPQTSASFRPIHIYGRHIGSAKSRDSATRRSTSIISARRFPPEKPAYRVSNLGKLVGVSSDL